MTPTVERLADGVELWLGDCRDCFEQIGLVDHVLMDPPYESHMHKAKAAASGRKAFGAKRRIRTDGHANPPPVDFSSIDGLREVVVEPLVKSCSGWFIAFCTPEGISPWRDAIEAADARYKRACFWVKTDGAPQFNGQGPAFAVEPFVTAWCGKGVSRWNGGGRRNWFVHATNQPDRDGNHPTEKPLPLMSEIVALFTSPDERILDPFMGSGTTGVSAVRAGRRFVGVETDPKYFAVAARRIQAALRQTDMFVEIAKPIRQEAML